MEQTFKIAVFGDSGVGKTTYIHTLKKGKFIEECSNFPSRELLKFNTTKGEIKFNVEHSISTRCFEYKKNSFCSDCDAAIVMCSSSDTNSMINIVNWLINVQDFIEQKRVVVCVNNIGKEKVISLDPILNYLCANKIPKISLSVKDKTNLKRPFILLAKKLLNDRDLKFIEPPLSQEDSINVILCSGYQKLKIWTQRNIRLDCLVSVFLNRIGMKIRLDGVQIFCKGIKYPLNENLQNLVVEDGDNLMLINGDTKII